MTITITDATAFTLRYDLTRSGVDLGPDTTDTITWTVDNPAFATLSDTTGDEITVTAGTANGTASIVGTNGTFATAPETVITDLPADGAIIVVNP